MQGVTEGPPRGDREKGQSDNKGNQVVALYLGGGADGIVEVQPMSVEHVCFAAMVGVGIGFLRRIIKQTCGGGKQGKEKYEGDEDFEDREMFHG